MSFGKYTYGCVNIYWQNNDAKLIVGNFCSIESNVKVYLGDNQVYLVGNHRTDWVTTYPFGHIHKNVFNNFNGEGHPSTKGDVNIGNDVWIGNNVTIMSGVKIGDGAVIGAGSVIAKDVPPYTIWVGNPAKMIKKRFTDEQIEKLLKLKWWNWSENQVREEASLLWSNNLDKFLEKYGS